MNQKRKKAFLLLVAAAAVAVGAVCANRAHYRSTHIFVENAVYEKDLTSLNLRGTGVSLEHIQAVQTQLPECEVIWELPFQGSFVAHDAQALTVTTLSDGDVALLDHLAQLKSVDASGCTDYPQILALAERRPECEVVYQVSLNGEHYGHDTEKLSFADADGEELMQMLRYLPRLKTVVIDAPTMPPEALLALVEAYPQISFSWNVEVLGTVYPSDTTAIDLSRTPLEGIEELEAGLAYLPALELLELHHCGLDDDLLAEYRERQADHYKVVWTVKLDSVNYIRSDATTFMPVMTFSGNLWDGNIANLKYCNEMVCIDVGHYPITHCDWAADMPSLQFLVVADTSIRSIEGLRGLENLIYLETFTTPLRDYSPLLEVPNLQDLNAVNSGMDIETAVRLKSLKRLWWTGYPSGRISEEEKQRLREAIPGCEFCFKVDTSTGMGWRKGKLYYEMRDLLGMPYFA